MYCETFQDKCQDFNTYPYYSPGAKMKLCDTRKQRQEFGYTRLLRVEMCFDSPNIKYGFSLKPMSL